MATGDRRRIPLEGATNFRDLGGYATADGRRIREGMVYRSDGLHRITARDHATLLELGVRVVCDLRYGEERAAEPTGIPDDSPIEVVPVGLERRPGPGFVDSLVPEHRDEQSGLAYLTGNYREYPRLYARAYRTLLGRLLDNPAGALVFHCTAGKDRAGFAAAVLLTALGVPPATVLEDYLATNRYWDRGGRVPAGWPAAVVEAIFTARPEYLQAGFAVIEADFGSFDAYVAQEVGFSARELEALREKLLEP